MKKQFFVIIALCFQSLIFVASENVHKGTLSINVSEFKEALKQRVELNSSVWDYAFSTNNTGNNNWYTYCGSLEYYPNERVKHVEIIDENGLPFKAEHSPKGRGILVIDGKHYWYEQGISESCCALETFVSFSDICDDQRLNDLRTQIAADHEKENLKLSRKRARDEWYTEKKDVCVAFLRKIRDKVWQKESDTKQD